MNKINKGFTMAEVLITIGIIGLVAALTIPHLTSHYRKTVTETRLARFYSVIKKGVEPYMHGWDGTVEMLKNNPSLGCQQIVSNERAYCAALIQHNGWKIPKDYPLRF